MNQLIKKIFVLGAGAQDGTIAMRFLSFTGVKYGKIPGDSRFREIGYLSKENEKCNDYWCWCLEKRHCQTFE